MGVQQTNKNISQIILKEFSNLKRASRQGRNQMMTTGAAPSVRQFTAH